MYVAITHHWYLCLLTIAAIVLLSSANNLVIAIRDKLTSFRLKLLFYISDRLEPDSISMFRHTVSKAFDELSDFLEKSELELLRSRMNNVFLREKIQELERNREALLQELGGSSDFLSIEFSVWQQITQTCDLLISDRLALLQQIETINSYNGNIEKLLRDFDSLQEKNQSTEQKISALSKENSSLQLKNKQLLRNNDDLEFRLNQFQNLAAEKEDLKKEIVKLTNSNAILQQQLDQTKKQINQLEKQNSEATTISNNLKISNQISSELNERLKGEVEKLSVEISLKEVQIQQLLIQVSHLESSKHLDILLRAANS